MKCEEVLNELSVYVDRRENSRERCEIEGHLVICAAPAERAPKNFARCGCAG